MLSIFLLVVVIGGWTAAIVWLTRRTSDVDVAVFADFYGVPLTESNVDQLRQALQRSRRFRLAGALAAVGLGAALFGLPSGWAIFGYLAGGFAGGSLADELTRRRSPGSASEASLERRTLRTFLKWWVIAVVGLAALAVAAQVVTALQLTSGSGWFGYSPSSSSSRLSAVPGTGAVSAWAGAAAVALLLGAALLRRLVQAPTPAMAPDRAAAQHAVRTAAVVSVAGATMMVLGVVAVRLGSATTLHDSAEAEWFRWVDNIAYFVGLAATFIGGNLTLRAFPRGSWFRQAPGLSRTVDAS